jgi:sarcosine oxidase subunit gamma
MSEVKLESPLVGQTEALHGANPEGSGGVILRERPFLGHISIQGKGEDAAFTEACAKTLGLALPTTPNTQATGEDVIVCWLRPTEWLVLTEGEASRAWLDRLRSALEGVHSGVVDLSGGQTLIEIRGEHAVDTLAKGTTLDLHPRRFGAGQCARSQLAKTTAFIRAVVPGQAFDIMVRRSFADYLWQWLYDAASEYDCIVEQPESALKPAAL